MGWRERFGSWIAERIAGKSLDELAISVRIDDSDGWQSLNGRGPQDDVDYQSQYTDALTAWRKNPLARRIVQITSDYVLGEGIGISSDIPGLQKFIDQFWHHEENRIGNRLETMCDELSRAGDLFPVLFLNRHDGVSYLRFITKDQVLDIETAKKDWEKELTIVQQTGDLADPEKKWYTPANGRSRRTDAVILHYHVNRPLGAKLGESDLGAIIPWLLKYSRMLEDRVRFHWAVRAFLWIVTVPTSKVRAKAEQYKTPPSAGSIVVKDDAESWEALSPPLRGAEAAHDMQAVRQMVDAGSGYPPHWRGEATDVNLATAIAMQAPAERHLKRRQNYFAFMLQDIIYQAYLRGSQLHPERWPELATNDYRHLFTVSATDVSTVDNESLARASNQFADVLKELTEQYPGSNKLRRLLLRLALKFAGEPLADDELDEIMQETGSESVAKSSMSVNGTVRDVNGSGVYEQN